VYDGGAQQTEQHLAGQGGRCHARALQLALQPVLGVLRIATSQQSRNPSEIGPKEGNERQVVCVGDRPPSF